VLSATWERGSAGGDEKSRESRLVGDGATSFNTCKDEKRLKLIAARARLSVISSARSFVFHRSVAWLPRVPGVLTSILPLTSSILSTATHTYRIDDILSPLSLRLSPYRSNEFSNETRDESMEKSVKL